MILMKRPATSDADEWQLYLQDGLRGQPDTACAFLAVQIVEAIEEHQRALATEVYRLAEDAAMRFSDLASEDTPSGHFYRGSIDEAKSIARAINAIMPYSRDPAALSHIGGERPGASPSPRDQACSAMLGALEEINARIDRMWNDPPGRRIDKAHELAICAAQQLCEKAVRLARSAGIEPGEGG